MLEFWQQEFLWFRCEGFPNRPSICESVVCGPAGGAGDRPRMQQHRAACRKRAADRSGSSLCEAGRQPYADHFQGSAPKQRCRNLAAAMGAIGERLELARLCSFSGSRRPPPDLFRILQSRQRRRCTICGVDRCVWRAELLATGSYGGYAEAGSFRRQRTSVLMT